MHDPLYDRVSQDTAQREAQGRILAIGSPDDPETTFERPPTPEEKTLDKMAYPNNRAGRRAAAKAARRGAR